MSIIESQKPGQTGHTRRQRGSGVRWLLAAGVVVLLGASLALWWYVSGRDPTGSASGPASPQVAATQAVDTWIDARNAHDAQALLAASTPNLVFLELGPEPGKTMTFGPSTSQTAREVFSTLSTDLASRVEKLSAATMLDDTHVALRTHVTAPNIGEDTDGLAIWTVQSLDGSAKVSQLTWIPDPPVESMPGEDAANAAVTTWAARMNAHDAPGVRDATALDVAWVSADPDGTALQAYGDTTTPSGAEFVSTMAKGEDTPVTMDGDPVAMDKSHVIARTTVAPGAAGSGSPEAASGLMVWTVVQSTAGEDVASQIAWLPDQ